MQNGTHRISRNEKKEKDKKMKRYGMLCLAAILFCAVIPLTAAEDEAAGDANVFGAMVREKSPVIVNVRMVLSVVMSFRGSEREMEREVDVKGVLIDPSGLILISSAPLGGGGNEQSSMSTTPLDVKITFAGDDEEYDALIVVTDSNLNLTYLQIIGQGEKKTAALGFEECASAAIGQELIGVSRHGKGFDYAPYFDTVRVTGRIEQPRPCWSVSGGFRTQGLPLFDDKGGLVGILTTQKGSNEPAAGGEGGGGGRRPGGNRSMNFGRRPTDASLFLVPAETVKANLPQVLELARKALKEL